MQVMFPPIEDAIDFHDVVFFSSIILCMVLGSYYKKIDDFELKRNYGAGLGLLVACVICGHQVYHTVFFVWGNIVIIKCFDIRYSHQLSFVYTWTYLVYLHFNPNMTIYTIWLHQTIALRVVGLATDMHISNQSNTSNKSLEEDSEHFTPLNPTATDIISYSFFFIGLQKGPFYRWKIFNDHFTAPFGVLGDCRVITEHKLKKALVCSFGYLLLRMRYDPHAYHDDNFYVEVSNESRYMYNLPQMLMYMLYHQMLMLLCTCVYTEAGFGVYPAKCLSTPGHGPTVANSLLKLASTTVEVALKQEYNFAMLRCFSNDKVIFGPKMRDTLRSWDMASRYWFSTYVFNQLNYNRELRSALAFAAWWVWSGASLPRLLLCITLWIYVWLEDEFSHLWHIDETTELPRKLGFSLMRIFCLLYLTPCLIVTDTVTVLRYYNSIYWSYHVILLLLIVVAAVIVKMRGRTLRESSLN